MTKFDNKINGNTVSADEYNNIVGAPKNLIENSGQTIDSSNTQLSKAVANYVASGSFYTDSGITNAYVLNTTGSFQAPTEYVDGMEIRFRTSNTNIGASTINVNGLGAKNIKNSDGTTDILAGFISNNRDISLRFYNDSFIPSNEITQATTSTSGQSILSNPVTVVNGTDNEHDLDFSEGNFEFSDGSGQATITAMTKRFDAPWVAGTGNGGLDTGSLASDTAYYVYEIYNPTTGISDFIGTTTFDSPTLPSGFTKRSKNIVVDFVTDGSGNIRNGRYIFNDGGYFFYLPINGVLTVSADGVFTLAEKTINLPIPNNIFPKLSIFIQSSTSVGGFSAVFYYSNVSLFVSEILSRGSGSAFPNNLEISDLFIDDSVLRYNSNVAFTALNARVLLNGWERKF